MSAIAIVMMLLSIGLVWGGLLASVLYLRSHKLPEDHTDVEALESLAAMGEERLGGFHTRRSQQQGTQ